MIAQAITFYTHNSINYQPYASRMKNATRAIPSATHAGDKIPFTATKTASLRGITAVAGDKSISHRALMFAAIVRGTTHIEGLLEGEDVMRTAQALRDCGVSIRNPLSGVWEVDGVGVGGLQQPQNSLDMGNAGTAARLLMGLLAGYPYSISMIGDASLSKRPMRRVTTPLMLSGAQFVTSAGDTLPLTMRGSAQPQPITYTLPVASAQVKSAVLLAGLNTPGTTEVTEPEPTRDHTERMLAWFGFNLTITHDLLGTRVIRLQGQPEQTTTDRAFSVPADPSSAAFPVVAALITPDSEVTVKNVCINPLRTGLFDSLKEMGAQIHYSNLREVAGEPVADITARTSALKAIEVPAHRAPSMIDEYPILAIAAACATGSTAMRGLSELRVKESDRLSAVVAGLRACGVDAREENDDLIVTARGQAPVGGATITTHFDHRIAMSFLVLGGVSQQPITVDDGRAIATSFPNFVSLMNILGANIECHKAPARAHRQMVIAVDGPAASGKGTLARRLADHFGLAYLDTGSLYRAVGMRVLYAEKNPSDVAAAIAAARALQPHDLANPKIRSERMGKAASIVSAIAEVREALLDYQRNFASTAGGAVLDGRDIGTVICPDADVKFFITASLEARAKRRHKQLQEYGMVVDFESVKADLAERDARDSARSVAPLIPANNAVVLDTSALTANEAFAKALEAVENAFSHQ